MFAFSFHDSKILMYGSLCSIYKQEGKYETSDE